MTHNKFDSKFLVDICNNWILSAAHAKNLGVYIDSVLNFQHHIKNTVKMCNYFIHDFLCFRKHHCLALTNALVSSRFDYCNSAVLSIIIVYLIKLQNVQKNCPELSLCPPGLLAVNYCWTNFIIIILFGTFFFGIEHQYMIIYLNMLSIVQQHTPTYSKHMYSKEETNIHGGSTAPEWCSCECLE